MTQPLDVLVVESHPHAADDAAAVLAAEGHRVHRCHEPSSRGFPCQGVLDPEGCPLDHKVDVALVVRRGVNPWPTQLEAGISCAIRSGIPVVEDGPDVLDPYAPWVTRRIGSHTDVVTACTEAADLGREPLRADIMRRVTNLLAAAEIDPGQVRCRLDDDGHSLDVHLELPIPAERRLEHALAVRVLDAVRAANRTYGHVDVFVEPTTAPA